MFHICMSLLLLFGSHGSPIQPLRPQSILIGCSTCLVFSKKHPYWMVLMPVYVETAEGLVKPLVILPAAVMPLPPLSLFSHDVIVPLFWMIHSFLTTHLTPFYLTNSSHTLYSLYSPIVPIILLHLGTFPTYGRTM